MSWLKERITIVAGHYGSGKTEFSINLALQMAKTGCLCRLIDLDIVNPYFRSYECRDILEQAGVEVIVSSLGGSADIPALPPEVAKAFIDEQTFTIIDLGGDPVGARVLGFYEPQLNQSGCDLWFVSNARRPEIATANKAMGYMRAIEIMAKQKISGIVNNTHLTRETSPADILAGEALALTIATQSAVPLICTTAEEHLISQIQGELQAPLFPLRIYLRKPWELEELEN